MSYPDETISPSRIVFAQVLVLVLRYLRECGKCTRPFVHSTQTPHLFPFTQHRANKAKTNLVIPFQRPGFPTKPAESNTDHGFWRCTRKGCVTACLLLQNWSIPQGADHYASDKGTDCIIRWQISLLGTF